MGEKKQEPEPEPEPEPGPLENKSGAGAGAEKKILPAPQPCFLDVTFYLFKEHNRVQ